MTARTTPPSETNRAQVPSWSASRPDAGRTDLTPDDNPTPRNGALMSTTTRRTFLRQSSLAIGGVALIGARPGLRRRPASSAPTEATHVRTAFSWIPAAEWGSWYLAEANGYFEQNGIDSELIHGGPNTPAVSQIMAGGGTEMGIAADELELINSNAEGSDYVIMAASYQRSPFGYCWLTETPISEPADLVGKRIGGVQGDQIRIDAVFAINGLDADYEFVPMSYDPQPLVDGEMDLMTCYVTNQPISLRMQGVDVTAVTFSDFGLTTYGDVIFASRAWLDDNRDVAVRYFRGLIAGADALVADPESMIPILMDDYGQDAELDEEFETAANVEYINLMQSDFTDANGLLAIDLEFVRDSVYPSYEAAGVTDLPDIDTLFDVSIAQDARA
jgi:ABC-type nitrate/sulfonate/bicarbonate transport system substrate-binding protein